MAPIQFLLQYFNISSGINFDQSKLENAARDDVDKTESDINDSENSDDEIYSDTDANSDDESNRSDNEDSRDESDSENDSRLIFA